MGEECFENIDFGEGDLGEDGFIDHHPEMGKQNIKTLHKYRERIQVLNEDLDVLIFDGEEDIELKVSNMEHKKEQSLA